MSWGLLDMYTASDAVNGSAAKPLRGGFAQPDAPELFPAKRPSSSSQKTASRLHGLDSLTLLSEHRSPTATPDARQRSMGPAHMSRLAASPLTDATSLQDKRSLR